MKKKEIKEEKVEVKEKKKMSNTKKTILIILCIIFAYGLVVYGGIFFFAFIVEANSKVDYKKTKDGYYLEKFDTNVKVTGSEYNEKEDCYYIYFTAEKNSNKEYKFNSGVDFTFKVKDSEGYILGSAFGSINDINEDTKWKAKAEFCDVQSKNSDSFELKEVSAW